MKPLPIRLRKNGFNYTLVQRGSRSCIYEQEVSKNQKHYEVFLIKIKPERFFHNKILVAAERFPYGEAFGSWAWSCWTLEEAQIKFNELES